MIKNKTLKYLEYDKILNNVSKYTVLSSSASILLSSTPETDYLSAKYLLNKTNEAYKLYYEYGVGNIEYFEQLTDELDRAKKNSILSLGEILNVSALLRASRILATSISNVNDESLVILNDIANRIFYDSNLENSINTKIVNDTTVADNASEKLYQIRQKIKVINERIREKLASFMRSGGNKYLQDNIVSIRSGRYVIPVKSEHVTQVKGFIHDRSASGSTFFIEPQEILDMNNELRTETLNESAEIERILLELTEQIGVVSDNLTENLIYLSDVDIAFSKAQYAHSIKAVYPNLNANGEVDIVEGRHPLIDMKKVVPINVNFGKDYNYILVTGPNTGGKTVTLKLIGLFTLMCMSGIFIPAKQTTKISVFSKVLVDIGDEQSIEQNLSTFSSHIKNLIEIVEEAGDKTLVLIDEIGAGTDPDEGSALAKSILEELISKNSYGVITTHYSLLKEYALTSDKIINASMDFDSDTFAPLYRIRIGAPGTSNAIEIASRLGIDKSIINRAKGYMSDDKISFENVLKQAEKTRSEAEKQKQEIEDLLVKQKEIYDNLVKSKEKFERERENFLVKAKAEARKIVNEKLENAEDMLMEMKEIFNKAEYIESDLVKMSTLKNKIDNEKYVLESEDKLPQIYQDVDIKKLKIGDTIFVKSLNSSGEVLEINEVKKCVWALVGSIRINCKLSDISFISKNNSKPKNVAVTLKRDVSLEGVKTEINVIGLPADEALMEVDNFIDKSILNNLEEVRIVHGKGMKILSTAIANRLRGNKNVKSYRFGKYGEGEHGVTIVKLK